MKKAFIFIMFTLLLASFVLADSNQGNPNDSEEGVYVPLNESEGLLGASCGTVSPGYQNECCINKGYTSWDEEKFECVKEREGEEDDSANKICSEAIPGTKTQCCFNEGYTSWNQKESKCIGKREGFVKEREDSNCEAWKCTEWTACNKDWQKTRRCVKTSFNCTADNEKPNTVKECWEKDQLRIRDKTRDCPEKCECSGSTTKCSFENGTRVMTIYAGNSGNTIVQVKNTNMSTNVELYKGDDGKVYAILRDGEKEIILPDKVKERIREKTRARLDNESLNLTEDGNYEFQANKRARLFGMFPVKEKVEYTINSETGEVTKTKTRWWGFLAKDIEEETELEDESEVEDENPSEEQ